MSFKTNVTDLRTISRFEFLWFNLLCRYRHKGDTYLYNYFMQWPVYIPHACWCRAMMANLNPAGFTSANFFYYIRLKIRCIFSFANILNCHAMAEWQENLWIIKMLTTLQIRSNCNQNQALKPALANTSPLFMDTNYIKGSKKLVFHFRLYWEREKKISETNFRSTEEK